MDFKTKLVEEKLVEDGCWNPRTARWYSGNLINEITSNFENLVGKKAASTSEAAYFAYHDMKALPPCKNCNKPVEKYVSFGEGYRDYCSVKCAKSDPEIIARTKATALEKYGVSNVSQSSAVRKKRSETMQERYGDAVYYRTEDFKAKAKKTIQENFGVDHQMHSDEVKAKIAKTNMERYGVSNPMSNDDIREKASQTNLNRYGASNPLLSTEILERIKQTNIEKYGHENPWGNRDVISKSLASREETYDRKWNGRHPSQINYSDDTYGILSNSVAFADAFGSMPLNTLSDKLGVAKGTIRQACEKYGIKVPHSRSRYEDEITAFLDNHGIKHRQNTRKAIPPNELDFYVEEQKIGIEFNGLYYHSDDMVSKVYHLRKHNQCKDAGIRLLMINEDEWLDRKESIKRKILNLVGQSEKGVGARKLSIRKISNATANDFVDTYHIQGKTGAVVASYGAYDGDRLAAVIQYNHQRGTQDIELIRFCTDGKLYAGVFSRLFKASVKEEGYTKVISFADLRYSDGGVYQKNGFVLEDTIRPDYRYIKGLKTFHKSSFTKAAISKKFGIDMTDRTEREVMVELGYRRIYDCGKLKYVWYS